MVEPEFSVPEILRQRAERDPAGVLIQEVTGQSISNAEFHAAAIGVANALSALGVQPGDCVVTVNDACIAAHACWIGICWAGAMEVPVNPEFRGNSLSYGINDSKARILITSNAHLPTIAQAREQLPFIEHILTLDETPPESMPDVLSLPALVAKAPFREYPTPGLTDPYAVVYTSGTTGPSKGVVVPWGSIEYSGLDRMFAGYHAGDHADAAFYSPWPMFHSSGRTGMVFAACHDGRFVLRQRLSVSAFWEDVRRFGCTHTHLLGISNYLMAQPEQPDDADNPLECVLMNPVLPEYREFERRFAVKITTGWGMTEIGFPMAASDLPNFRTCGSISPLYEARIIGDDGTDVADGQVGELVIRPKRPWLLLKEYLNKPEATAKAWEGGWFHTGDALRRESNGHYYFADRVKDYLRVRGNNVSSMELENEVLAHPAVGDVAAIGVPAALCPMPAASGRAASSEDEIKLVVVLKPEAELLEAELLAFLIPRLPPYMVPRFIEFTDILPRTPTGKVQKQKLRDVALNERCWDRHFTGAQAAG